jgi:hypothetical protein
MRTGMILSGSLGLLLCGCHVGEWNSHPLVNRNTGEYVSCLTPWGQLPESQVVQLYQRVEACERVGFELQEPERLPPRPSQMNVAEAPIVPDACRTGMPPRE